MPPLNHRSDAELHKQPSPLKRWPVYLFVIAFAVVFVVGFQDELLSLISVHIDNYFKAQQALVDAQYFAC